MCLSDAALDGFRKEDPNSAILAEAVNNAHNHQFSSFLCLLSLSSVVNLPIESYHPAGPDNWKDSWACMFNCTFHPREWSTNLQTNRLHIFCCAVLPLDYLETRVVPQTKNNYFDPHKSESSSLVDEAYITQVLPTILLIHLQRLQKCPISLKTHFTGPRLCPTKFISWLLCCCLTKIILNKIYFLTAVLLLDQDYFELNLLLDCWVAARRRLHVFWTKYASWLMCCCWTKIILN